jgi:hypothetical protein
MPSKREPERGHGERVLERVAVGVGQVVHRQRRVHVAGDLGGDLLDQLLDPANGAFAQRLAGGERVRRVGVRVADDNRRAALRLGAQRLERLDPLRQRVIDPHRGDTRLRQQIAVAVRHAHAGAQQRRRIEAAEDVPTDAVAGTELFYWDTTHSDAIDRG